MIKNIVFDMGRVLLHYDSKRCCRQFIENPEDQELVNLGLFASQEWLLLDMGVISEEQALDQVMKKLPLRLHVSVCQCMEHWHEYCMWPVEGMAELVKDLKNQGYGIYLCSNASLRMNRIKDKIPGIEHFDGILFSAAAKCIKPQKELYHHFFSSFGLRPEECFFIDDLQVNIDGARACGMDGYCFSAQNIPELRQVLHSLRE